MCMSIVYGISYAHWHDVIGTKNRVLALQTGAVSRQLMALCVLTVAIVADTEARV